VIAAVLNLVLVGGLVHFQSPSGNINCYAGPAFQGSPAFAQCLVRKQSWPSLRSKPASCDLDWDPATVSLSRRRATVGSCRGDIGPLCVNTSDRCSTLGYGRSVDAGPIRCTSTTAGITCRYKSGRRQGFLIARERYMLYR
jgi:uncharacterized protein DUF6636